jgi:hypothetical protein
MKKVLTITLLASMTLLLHAQRAGEHVYSFLQLTNSSRAAALGGNVVSIYDDDINLVFHNPAILSAGMDQHMALNYVNYFAGINYGYAAYSFRKEPIGNFLGGIHYVDYGTFQRTDPLGNPDGTFRASEYALNLVWSRTLIDTFLMAGINLKPIFSVYEQYTAFGAVMDAGLVYNNPRTNTSAGLVLKNLGMQLVSFAGTRESVPFEIQAGFSQGLEHAPFRFTVLYRNLERWDLTYEVAQDNDISFEGESEAPTRVDLFADRLMRHLVFGAELLIGDNFHADVGYNYRRRQELKMDTRPGLVGLSWGFGFKVSRFHVAYGRSRFHLAGGTHHFSFTTDLSTFYRKKSN